MLTLTPHASLLAHNTFGIDVHAALLAEYDNSDDLRQLFGLPEVQQLTSQRRQLGELPFWHIGSGSNLLFRGDYPGLILHCRTQGIEILADTPSHTLVEVQAGTVWDDVCAFCAREGIYGIENLSLIPGEAGAAAVQNIGAYGVEMKDVVQEVCCWDVQEQQLRRFTCEEMQYAYRQSLLKQADAKSRYVVLSLTLSLSRTPQVHLEYAGLKEQLGLAGDEPTFRLSPETIRQAVIAIRQGKLPDPKVLGNAGSFFKNPVVSNDVAERLLLTYPTMPHYAVGEHDTKIPAGWLIEQCGWKGRSLGRAGIYSKQCLVLVNLGGATPDELITLCQTVQRDVHNKFGIDIEAEVNIV